MEVKPPKSNHDPEKSSCSCCLHTAHLNSSGTLLDCQNVSRCSNPALHAGKIEAEPLDFSSHAILITASKQGVSHPFHLGFLQGLLSPGISCQIQWELLPRGQDATTVPVVLRWIWTPSLSNHNTREEHR